MMIFRSGGAELSLVLPPDYCNIRDSSGNLKSITCLQKSTSAHIISAAMISSLA